MLIVVEVVLIVLAVLEFVAAVKTGIWVLAVPAVLIGATIWRSELARWAQLGHLIYPYLLCKSQFGAYQTEGNEAMRDYPVLWLIGFTVLLFLPLVPVVALQIYKGMVSFDM